MAHGMDGATPLSIQSEDLLKKWREPQQGRSSYGSRHGRSHAALCKKQAAMAGRARVRPQSSAKVKNIAPQLCGVGVGNQNRTAWQIQLPRDKRLQGPLASSQPTWCAQAAALATGARPAWINRNGLMPGRKQGRAGPAGPLRGGRAGRRSPPSPRPARRSAGTPRAGRRRPWQR